MHSASYDLAFLDAAINELDIYLRSRELLWPLSAKPPEEPGLEFPRFTLGSLILTLDELDAQRMKLTDDQIRELEEKIDLLNTQIAVQPVAVETKALREMQTRLNLWNVYVEEAVEGRGRSEFSHQVRNRVMLQRLVSLTISTEEAKEIMKQSEFSDELLEHIFRRGEFIWDPALSSQYDKRAYWFLYGALL